MNTECLQYLPELKQHPDKIKNKKQNMVMTTYTELLGTWIKSKKTRYINTVCTKSASKDYWIMQEKVMQDYVLTCTPPWSSQTNVQELI